MSVVMQPLLDAKPKHVHDCDDCVFLAGLQAGPRYFDLYFCPNEPTLIARYGEYGDYKSGLYFVHSDPHLHMAYEVAINEDRLTPQQRERLLSGLDRAGV